MKKQVLVPSILALFVASAAHAGATFDTAAGTLNIGADVEFDYTSETDKELFSSGRLLLDINGEKVLDNGNFAGFKLNPTWAQHGEAGSDDIWIKFGKKNNWNIQAGHFEAADLSPAGQDTYVSESGTLVYRANFARGRTDGDDDGQITFTKTLGESTSLELTTQMRDNGRTVIARPAISYSASKFSVVFGAEVPVITQDDNYENGLDGYTVADDGKDWIGFGGHVSYAATDALTVTLRSAYLLDDRLENNGVDALSTGLNVQYSNFFISALYGEVDAEVDADDSEEIQVYTSYKIPTILDIESFDIYVAAGWSEAKIADTTQDDEVGVRVRLKYIF